MLNQVQSIALDKLVAHPDNPNRMSKAKFSKLIRNIERTGRYESLVVRPCPQKPDCFQIINGHHRFAALKQLGYTHCDCVVWNVNDDEALVLLSTLNRLSGSDVLDKKISLLKKLTAKRNVAELSKLLPQTKTQIKRLVDLHKTMPSLTEVNTDDLAHPMVFFLSTEQKQIVEKALSSIEHQASSIKDRASRKTKAQRNAEAITKIAQGFFEHKGTKTQRHKPKT